LLGWVTFYRTAFGAACQRLGAVFMLTIVLEGTVMKSFSILFVALALAVVSVSSEEVLADLQQLQSAK
jgi:hypothetical protein